VFSLFWLGEFLLATNSMLLMPAILVRCWYYLCYRWVPSFKFLALMCHW